jgi:hypothetical protein
MDITASMFFGAGAKTSMPRRVKFWGPPDHHEQP